MLGSILALTGLLAPGPAATDPGPRAVAQVAPHLSVQAGRAVLVQPERVRRLGRGDALRVSGAARLELASRSRVEISWAGRGSLILEGPASVDWTADTAAPLFLEDFRSLELEVRDASFGLELPEAWALEVSRAALAVSRTPDGGLQVAHHGGRPVRVVSRIPRKGVDWPRSVPAGARVRLPALEPTRGAE